MVHRGGLGLYPGVPGVLLATGDGIMPSAIGATTTQVALLRPSSIEAPSEQFICQTNET